MAFRHLQNKTSEPVATIRAALDNRSLCLFFCMCVCVCVCVFFFFFFFFFQFLFLANGEGSDNLFTLLDHKKLSRLYHFSTNIKGDVSCWSVNWPLVTPRHKWFRQNRTHLTTYLRLKKKKTNNKKQDKRAEDCTTFSFFRNSTPLNRIYTTNDKLTNFGYCLQLI